MVGRPRFSGAAFLKKTPEKKSFVAAHMLIMHASACCTVQHVAETKK